MPTFSLTRLAISPADLTMSRITDLILNGNMLYSTTHYDGAIRSWDIANTTSLAVIDSAQHSGALRPAAQPGLSIIAGKIMSGGGANGQMMLRTLDAGGNFGAAQTLTGTGFSGDLIDTVTVTLSDGRTVAYGGIGGGSGIGSLVFSAAGAFQSAQTIVDTSATFARDITTMASGAVGGDSYVFSASSVENGVTAWRVGATGNLTATGSLGISDGMWIDAPSAMTTAVVGGVTYLIMGAAGSSSLSVMAVGADGSLTLRDHVLDDLDTRFAGMSALTTVTHGGQVFVFAAGSDDGISAFSLLPGGQLLHRGQIADTNGMTLADVSSLVARSRGDGIDLFAASATEPGLSRLRFDTGAAGALLQAGPGGGTLNGTAGFDMLIGAAGNDRIIAGSGDDVILDGAGSDTLTGGAGADVFVFAYDGASDTVTDFTQGQDRIDLSAWQGLRSVSQLFMTQTSDGIRITYGSETLIVINVSGAPIAPGSLADADLIGGTHVPDVILPGFSGPVTSPPSLPSRQVYVAPAPPPVPGPEGLELIGTSRNDVLHAAATNDMLWGQSGNDQLFGESGADILNGGSSADMLYGGDGNDTLYGGGGREMDWTVQSKSAATNGDSLFGGAGDDTLYGQAGNDWLSGGSGNDAISGGGGRDTFVYDAGRDHLKDFSVLADRLLLGDALWSGTISAATVVSRFGAIENGSAVLDFGGGNVLHLDGVTSLTGLAHHIAFF